MAVRNIIKQGDEILTKVCRPVENFDKRLAVILDDMKETLRHADGVGLAAPQIGILRRYAIVNVGNRIVDLINPNIIEKSGRQEDMEGCLSCPSQYGITVRPQKVKVKAFDRNGKEFIIEGEGLIARAFCHEIDHLDGILFKDRAIKMLSDEELKRYIAKKGRNNKKRG